MNEKTIFEIPVYSMSQENFDKRWNRKKLDLFNDFVRSGHTDESAKSDISRLLYPRYVWQYNQIIGFITISVTKTDVIFEVYCTMDKKLHIDSKSKHFIIYHPILGNHFYVGDKSEVEIKQEIKEMLKDIETSSPLSSKLYIDYSAFNNLFEFVNIKQIINSL